MFPTPKIFTVMIKFDHETVAALARADADGTDADRLDMNGADTDGWIADDAFPGSDETWAWLAPQASRDPLA